MTTRPTTTWKESRVVISEYCVVFMAALNCQTTRCKRSTYLINDSTNCSLETKTLCEDKRSTFAEPGVRRRRRRRRQESGEIVFWRQTSASRASYSDNGERGWWPPVAPEAEGPSAQRLVSADGSCWAGWRSTRFVLGDKGEQWACVNASNPSASQTSAVICRNLVRRDADKGWGTQQSSLTLNQLLLNLSKRVTQ